MTIIGLHTWTWYLWIQFPAAYYNNMIIVSKFSTAFSGLFIILTIFLVTLSHKFYENHQNKISDFIAIKLFFYWLEQLYMVSFGT
jgi:NADH-quinone oxidoreductase subunit N